MSDYKELLRISKKSADAWRNDSAYYQAAVLIDSLCDTVKTILSERDAAVSDINKLLKATENETCEFCKWHGDCPEEFYSCANNAEWRGIGGSYGT